jgi:hypothetical protein
MVDEVKGIKCMEAVLGLAALEGLKVGAPVGHEHDDLAIQHRRLCRQAF